MRAMSPNSNFSEYHKYKVTKDLPVRKGIIQAWFDQPGGGIQYKMNMSIEELLKAGKIRRIN